jgi:hypothetical protein
VSTQSPLLSAFEPGRRNRRTVDAFFLLAAAIVIGLTAVVASETREVDANVAEALTTLFGWANGFWRAAFVALLALALAVIADVLLRRRWSLARDLVVTLLPLRLGGNASRPAPALSRGCGGSGFCRNEYRSARDA